MDLETVGRLDDGFGTQLVFSSDGARWAAARPGVVNLWEGSELRHVVEVPGYRLGPIVVDESAQPSGMLRLDRWAVDLGSGAAEARQVDPDWLVAHLRADRNLYSVRASAPAVDGTRLAVVTGAVPSRLRGDGSVHDGPGGQILLQDLDTGVLLSVIEEDTAGDKRVLAVRGPWVAAAGASIALWEHSSGSPHGSDTSPGATAREIRFDALGDRLAVARVDGTVEIRSVPSLDPVARWTAHPSPVTGIDFHPALPLFATASADEQVKIWSLDGESEPELVGSHLLGDAALGLAFHPYGEHLAVATDDDEIVMLQLRT